MPPKDLLETLEKFSRAFQLKIVGLALFLGAGVVRSHPPFDGLFQRLGDLGADVQGLDREQLL